MLTEGQSLYLIIILIYLSECVAWIPGHAFVFVGGFAGKWRVRLPKSGLGNERGRLVLTNPLPFAGGLTVATLWPLAVGSEGLSALKRSCAGGSRRPRNFFTSLPWPTEPILAADREVCTKSRTLCQTASFREAKWLAGFLEKLRTAADRPTAAAEQLRETLDGDAFRRRKEEFSGAAGWLSVFAVVEFLILFAAAPLALQTGGSGRFLMFIGLLFLMTFSGSLLFYFAHRKLYPDRAWERLQQTLLAALVPTHSIRAADSLSRGLAGDFHVLTVAAVLCSPAEWQRLAGIFLRDLRHPMPLRPDAPSEAAAIANAFHFLEKDLLESFVATCEMPAPVLEPHDATASGESFCPRCLASYLSSASECQDCQIPLTNSAAAASNEIE